MVGISREWEGTFQMCEIWAELEIRSISLRVSAHLILGGKK